MDLALALRCILKDVCMETWRWEKRGEFGNVRNANFKESTANRLASKDNIHTDTASSAEFQSQSGTWVNRGVRYFFLQI